MTSTPPSAPPIDPRTHRDFVDQTTRLAEHFSDWQAPKTGPDLGLALIEIFAGMAGQVADRLNRVPDRDLLAFLELIGIRLLPAQAARGPLTFTLADGQSSAFVPAGTATAVPARAGADEVRYATERDLTLTAARLVAVYVREPASDRMADVSGAATGVTSGAWPAFVGDSLIEHALYVGHDRFVGLPRPRSLAVVVSCVDAAARQAFQNLPLEWSWWDGRSWEPVMAPVVTTRDDDTVVVTLGDIPEVAAAERFGRTARWLRARLTRAIQLVGPVPGVRHVAVGVTHTATAPVAPDSAFANSTELDLSRDWYPFTEVPRFNEAFLLTSPALARSGGSITMHVDVSTGLPVVVQPSLDLVVAWEVGSAEGWVEVGRSGPGVTTAPAGFADGTQALRVSGDVTFTVPQVGGPLSVNGVDGFWLRARIVQGDYGKAAHTSGQPPVLVAANIAPPSIRTIGLGWSLTGEEAPAICLTLDDARWADVTAAAGGGSVLVPFRPSQEPTPALYLGFDAPFPNRPMSLYFVAEPLPFDPDSSATGEGSGGVLQWAYGGPHGWAALSVVDETQGFGRSGLVGFVGPADFEPSVEFGRTLWWLRVDAGPTGPGRSPQLRRILTNTMWATNATVHRDEMLGTSDASPGQRRHTTQAPILGNEVVEVAESGTAAATGSATVDGAGPPWSVWTAMPDFSSSGPDDRHYVIDHRIGEITFGDGRRGRVPPAGSSVRVTYRSGGGSVGNCAFGAVTELRSALAGVSGVYNPDSVAGGADPESLDRLRQRGPRRLRHGDRAVAAADYEDLAREALADVARALALPPSINPLDLAWITPSPVTPTDPDAPAPINQSILCRADPAAAAAAAQHAAGRVAVAVTPNDESPQPVPSPQLLDTVRQALLARVPAILAPDDLAVLGPEWMQITVRAEVAGTSLDAAGVPAAVVEALTRFLHPLYGGSDGGGWPFGRIPHQSDLYAIIAAAPGVDHVRSLAVDMVPDPSTLPAERIRRSLVWSGAHEVVLTAQSEASPRQAGSPA